MKMEYIWSPLIFIKIIGSDTLWSHYHRQRSFQHTDTQCGPRSDFLEKQSDLDPHSLIERHFKGQADDILSRLATEELIFYIITHCHLDIFCYSWIQFDDIWNTMGPLEPDIKFTGYPSITSVTTDFLNILISEHHGNIVVNSAPSLELTHICYI